jgi:hypothetical protein
MPPVNASYLHERLRPRFVTGLPRGRSIGVPFGELATDADVTRILHGRPAALDPKAGTHAARFLRTLCLLGFAGGYGTRARRRCPQSSTAKVPGSEIAPVAGATVI